MIEGGLLEPHVGLVPTIIEMVKVLKRQSQQLCRLGWNTALTRVFPQPESCPPFKMHPRNHGLVLDVWKFWGLQIQYCCFFIFGGREYWGMRFSLLAYCCLRSACWQVQFCDLRSQREGGTGGTAQRSQRSGWTVYWYCISPKHGCHHESYVNTCQQHMFDEEMSGDLTGKNHYRLMLEASQEGLHIAQLVHVCVGETKSWNYRRTEHSDSKCCADLLGVPNWFNWLKWLNWLKH